MMTYLGLMNLPMEEELMLAKLEAFSCSSSATERQLLAIISKQDEAIKIALQALNKKTIDDFYWAVWPKIVDDKQVPGITKNIYTLKEEAKAVVKEIAEVLDKPIKPNFGDVNGNSNSEPTTGVRKTT